MVNSDCMAWLFRRVQMLILRARFLHFVCFAPSGRNDPIRVDGTLTGQTNSGNHMGLPLHLDLLFTIDYLLLWLRFLTTFRMAIILNRSLHFGRDDTV